MGVIESSPDLQRLLADGYSIAMKDNLLVMEFVPYVDADQNIRYGVLVDDSLSLDGEKTVRPGTHVIKFTGSYPCNEHGQPLEALRHTDQKADLGSIEVQHSFSNKPDDGYADYYHKFSRYAEILSAPAQAIDPAVTPRGRKALVSEEGGQFYYPDTASGRAGINLVSRKLRNYAIGIIGLGGTGSYILDFVAKTHVDSIHLFDGDVFLSHNAFRCPGAFSGKEISDAGFKVQCHAAVYGKLRRNIYVCPEFINARNKARLDELSFVFICVDDGAARKLIIEHLLAKEIPFIDVGMGVSAANDMLDGLLRVTVGSDEVLSNGRIPYENLKEKDEYQTNIQVVELNALNAVLAVIRWKKSLKFYSDGSGEGHATYTVDLNRILNEDRA